MFISNWNHIGGNLDLMSGLSQSLCDMERKDNTLLPNIRNGSIILIASDYGGQHNLSTHESLSFLFADLEECGEWDTNRGGLRKRFLPDNRRMSYKNLNDTKRQDALFPFLVAANSIPGLSITFLVHKGINSLFLKEGRLDTKELEEGRFKHWPNPIFEKLLRVLHFISFFVAGLSRPHQDVFWFTDEDAIVPNAEKLHEVNSLLAHIASHYLQHDMGNLRCRTTKCDDGSRLIEDFTSVPDLVAGALAEVLSKNATTGHEISFKGKINQLENLSFKTRQILAWFTDTDHPLKRLVCVLDPLPDSTKLETTWLKFFTGKVSLP